MTVTRVRCADPACAGPAAVVAAPTKTMPSSASALRARVARLSSGSRGRLVGCVGCIEWDGIGLELLFDVLVRFLLGDDLGNGRLRLGMLALGFLGRGGRRPGLRRLD